MMISRSIDRQRPMVQLLHRWCSCHANITCSLQHAPPHAEYFTETGRTLSVDNSWSTISVSRPSTLRGLPCSMPANSSRSLFSRSSQLPHHMQPSLTSSSASCTFTDTAASSLASQKSNRAAGSVASALKAKPGGSIGRGLATSPELQRAANSVTCPPGNTLVVDLRQSSRDVSLVANEDPSQLMFVSWPV